MHLGHSRSRRRSLALGLLLALISVGWLPAAAVAEEAELPTIHLAVVTDGPGAQIPLVEATFRREILELLEGEFEVEFETFEGESTRPAILASAQRAYDDPEVDMVLATGLAANQLLAARDAFPKPTFLPIVFNAELSGLPPVSERGSGVPNLHYLVSLDQDVAYQLRNFLHVVHFERVALLLDSILISSVSALAQAVGEVAAGLGVEVVLVPFEDPGADLVAAIPEDCDAVMTGGLFRLDGEALERLVQGLIDRRLPSYSFDGDSLVRQGIMVADSPSSDSQRLARRASLAIQAVALGEMAEDQPVDFEARRQFFVNMETARALDVLPRFDILVESTLVDDDPSAAGRRVTLSEVALEAVDTNLALLAERVGTEASAEDIAVARSNLLPQLSASLGITQLNGDSLAVESGSAAERSTTAALTLTQVIWSEPARAAVEIERLAQQRREAELLAFELDTVRIATLAFLDLLRAETQVRVQRDNLQLTRANLELAEDRVRVGTAGVSDVYRWQSQLATARQSAISAYSQRLQARENLNRVLHRPLEEPVDAVPATLDDPALLFGGGELDGLVDNPKTFGRLIALMVDQGLELAPELVALDRAIDAQKRFVLSLRRESYSPEVALQGQLSEVVEEDRVGPDVLEGELDWSLGVSGSLALTTGGSRRARRAQAALQLQQLELQREATREQIEQGIRASLYQTNASYMQIGLAQEAALAAGKSLDLVIDAYSQGAVSIIDLLDAQNAALQAREGASNAVYTFLIDLMETQRAIGRFDFFLDDAQRRAEVEYVQNSLLHQAQEDR